MLKLNKFTLVFVIIYVLIAACIIKQNHVISKQLANTQFATLLTKQVTPVASHAAVFQSTLIPQPKYLRAAHSATIVRLNDGRLLALWFAGSHEGKPDVNIWQSYFAHGKWSEATIALTRQQLGHETQQFIGKLGNPVVYQAINGKLYLFVVAVGLGGWSGSRIYQLTSFDNGKNWSNAHPLLLSPLLNISSLVRSRPLTLANGGFYLPVYHELIKSYPELLYFDVQGNLLYQSRFTDDNHLIQPSFLQLSQRRAFVYFRNHINVTLPIHYVETTNAGVSWSELKLTNIFNHDSSLATVAISNSCYIMLRNPIERGQLVIAKSTDGINWHDVYTLESAVGNEFSYPALIADDKMIDIVYTWQRKNIKHVQFNRAWLKRISNCE